MPRFDAWVIAFARATALGHPMWLAAMRIVTVGGGMSVLDPLVALGCLVLLVRGRWRPAAFVAVAMTVTVAVRLVVVAVIARPRPSGQLAPASNYSFPSGHSTASAAAALILVLVCWPLLRRRWSRAMLAAVAAVWAVAVGVSRVALVVHWPTDVLGAWLYVLRCGGVHLGHHVAGNSFRHQALSAPRQGRFSGRIKLPLDGDPPPDGRHAIGERR